MRLPPFPLPAWTPFWDPRPHGQATDDPIPGACNLPVNELDGRQAELPPKGAESLVVAEGEVAERVLLELASRGREGRTATRQESQANGPAGRCRMWTPNAFLESLLPQMSNPGRALDLGCGAGREALFMASWGYEVTAVDVLPDALEIGKELSKRYLDPNASAIDWKCLDLESGDPQLEGTFTLISSFRYLNRPLLARVSDLLDPGGSLVVETFTELHRQRHDKPRRREFVLALGELRELALGLEILEYSEDWREDAHTARLWARKR